jgi:hypothetical protein
MAAALRGSAGASLKFRELVKQAREREREQRAIANAREENWEVGQLLPIRKNRVTGDYDWAVPQVVTGTLNALSVPGKAARGEYPLVIDPETGVNYFEGMAEDAASLASTLTMGAGLAPVRGASLGMGFRVFHGSPHDFDRFDMSKIGTGEGAQAYGRGLYFAENQGVAEQYSKLPIQLQEIESRVAAAAAGGTVNDPAIKTAKNFLIGRADFDEAVQAAKAAASDPNVSPADAARFSAAAEWMKANERTLRHKPNLYEADIDAEPEDFLDWDTLARKAPPEVLEKVNRAINAASPHHGGVERFLAQWEGSPVTLGELFQDVTNRVDDPDAFIAALRAEGIPGIRYLDQGSRGKGDGSRNYVVFDDNLISILNKK